MNLAPRLRSWSSTLGAALKWVWLPASALALAGLVSLTPLTRPWSNAADDLLMRAVARPAVFDEVVVVDIDDASLRELTPRLGPWPYRRDVYALLVGYLRDAGAKVMVFDIVFDGAREGDEAFGRAIALRPDVVLAATGLRQRVERDPVESQALGRLTLAVEAGGDGGVASWPAMALPTARLVAGTTRFGQVGVISSPLAADRHLRRLPLLHRSGGRVYPSLSLAAHLLVSGQTDADAPRAGVAALRRDAAYWVRNGPAAPAIVFPSNAAHIPTVSFARLMGNALGAGRDEALHRLLARRAVFVGSSAFLGDTVDTAQGELTGTALLANAYAALGRGDTARAAPTALQAALLLLALLPCAVALRVRRPDWRRDAAAVGFALAAIAGLSVEALRTHKLQLSPMPALTTLAALVAMYALTRWRLLALANRRLADERHAAEAANTAKSEFLANVSHELRTPLNAVLGMADVLLQTAMTDEQRRYVSIFRNSGALLATLIDDLLDFSKIEAGELRLDLHAFSLRALLAQQVELLEPRARAKGLALTLDVAADVADVVQGDAKRLGQVLVNLVGNAVKFTSRGAVAVKVRRTEHGRLCFAVHDSGIGIARGRLEAIFRPFVQAESGVARQYGGTGLGLSITRHLVEMMGGQVWVESEPGIGSTFLFVVDLPPGSLPAATPQAVASTSAAADSVALLLAEDNEVNVVVFQAMLQHTPHKIDVAVDGEAAVEMFGRKRYGLLLMDIQMPRMDGLAATREIRRIEAERGLPRTPIVALTANAFLDDERKSLEAGCDDHIAKPVSRQRLMEAIERHATRPPPAASS